MPPAAGSMGWRVRGEPIPSLSQMYAALGLVQARPAAVAAVAWKRARGAADRVVPLIVEWVVRQIMLEDVSPDVLLGPVGERVELDDPAPLIMLELFDVLARDR